MPEIILKPVQPREAIDFFQAKGFAIGFDFRDVWQAEQQIAFTVAKAMQLELLQDIREEVDKALANGITFEQFKKDLQSRLVQRGWWGKAAMIDPLTGETRQVQLGSPRRLKTIYDTNLRKSYDEGQWQRIQDRKAVFPYLVYDANNSAQPREEHSAWDGRIVAVDDPWVANHFPRKTWGCKCRMYAITQRQAEARGITGPPSEPAPYEYVNPRSGEVQQIPKGVDPAFHYPPGGRQQALDKHVATLSD